MHKDIYKSIGEYNLLEKRKVLIVLDDIIADMITLTHFLGGGNELSP